MNTSTYKIPEGKSRSIANESNQKRSVGKPTFQFLYKSPEAVVQRNLQKLAFNNLRNRHVAHVGVDSTFLNVPKPIFSSCLLGSQKTIQRLQIVETLYLFQQGNPASKENIRAYFYEYEIPLMVQRVNEYCLNDQLIAQVNGLYRDYKARFSKNAQLTGGRWDQVALTLTILVQRINQALNGTAAPSGYEAENLDNWANVEDAVTFANHQVDVRLGTTNPQNHELATIPTIPWTSVKGNFPPTLMRLLRDIFASWRGGQVMDERSPAEQNNHTLNSESPGSLRSWHMNTSQTLPPNHVGPTPENAVNLEGHYQNTSGVMNALGVTGPAGPIGFAEYTGTGILNDAHNSKIILDYRRGDMYLTLTHYQFWTNEGNNFQTEGQKGGTKSPWFKIDMNS